MKHIKDEAGFVGAFCADRAVVYCHAEWSVPAVIGLKVFNDWAEGWLHHQESLSSVATYVAQPDEADLSLPKWLEQQGLGSSRYSGSGEVLWLERGELVAQVHHLASDRLRLSKVTLMVWPPTSPTQ